MKTTHLITAVALYAAGSALAADVPDYGAVAAQATLRRADVIAETKRAIASGELKFGALADYQAQFAPAPARPSQPLHPVQANGGKTDGSPVAMGAAKPALSAQQ